MKKIIVLLSLVLALSVSCTEQERVKSFGGSMTVNVPKGNKLIMATWKEANLFFLYEPMEEGYIPKNKTFQEQSAYGVMETKIIFVESR
jgi:hypothetical protein